MAKLNMVQALNLALHQEMAKDPSVVVLGEDVARDGGVFRVTEGLLAKFGEDRTGPTGKPKQLLRLHSMDMHQYIKRKEITIAGLWVQAIRHKSRLIMKH